MNRINSTVGRNKSYIVGGMIDFSALVLLYLLDTDSKNWVYPLAFLLGIGNSFLMVTSVCMEGDLVGTNPGGSAFVYGALSFTDKISNGIAILGIQYWREQILSSWGHGSVEDMNFNRIAFCIIPLGAVLAGMVATNYVRKSSQSIGCNTMYGT